MEGCGQAGDTHVSENGRQKKTWSELRGVVSELRRRLAGVSAGSVPASITFRTLPDGRWEINSLILTPIYSTSSIYLFNSFDSSILRSSVYRMRIYFLSTPSNGWETTLLYVDIAHSDNANGYKLNWQPVIEANFQRWVFTIDVKR